MQNQIDIRPLIQDLIDLSDKTNQEEISKLKKFSLAFVNNRDEVRKALRNRIKTWNEILDRYYEQSKDSNELLTHLKEVAKMLITGQKTNLLRKLIEREGYGEDPSLKKAIKRTEEMLNRIIKGRCYFEFSNLSFEVKKGPEVGDINKELMLSISPTKPISLSFQNVFGSSDSFDVSKEFLLSRVEGMSPDKDDAWFKRLAPTLADVEDIDKLNAVVPKLTFLQMIVLIQDYARNKNGAMILKLLKAAKDDMVLEIFKALSDKEEAQNNEIALINASIDEVKDQALIQSAFAYVREIFVAKSNSFTPDINLVAKKLREINKSDQITSFNILAIESFKKPIQDLQAANSVFRKLVEKRGHILECVTFHMPDRIDLTCKDRLKRVTNDAKSRKERDNLYSILVELSYGDLDEEDGIAEALGNMGIIEVNDFIKLGLNVSPLPAKNANDPNSSTRLQEEATKRYCEIFGHFEKLGLKTIGDLIDKNIYNYEQLKNYIGRYAYKPVSIPSSALKS